MSIRKKRTSVWLLALLMLVAGSAAKCSKIVFVAPLQGQLSLTGPVAVEINLPPTADPATVVVTLDDGTTVSDVTGQLSIGAGQVTGSVDVPSPGTYALTLQVQSRIGLVDNTRSFETVALANADDCEVLVSAECLLPFPSNRFVVSDATKPNGIRLELPAVGLPAVNGDPIDPAPFGVVDGFSPTAPILVHLPGAPDLALSGADVLVEPDPASPQTKPYSGIRTHLGISKTGASPTILMNAATGERVLHFVELDSRAGDPARQTLILRPAVALEPGATYIVALAGLVDGAGQPLPPEAPFEALRDLQPTDIPAIADRRAHYEANIFPVLEGAPIPVARADLQLAFDYTIQSSAGLTADMFSMRDQAYAWLADQIDVQANQTFTVTPFGPDPDADSLEFDCTQPDTPTWRIIRGTYQVPNFLTENPDVINSFGVVNRDANGTPQPNGVTNPDFTLSIPCTAKDAGTNAPHTILLGHGLFGRGDGLVDRFGGLGLPYVSGATDFRGLSSQDLLWVGGSVIGLNVSQLNNFPAFPDRLKQGMVNTLLLARMMKRGDFNVDPAFEVATGVGALPVGAEEYYFGASLGGIMGTFFASLTTDVERFNVDVPAMNFSLLLQRSTQFDTFENLLTSIGLTDPMQTLLGLSLQHELWVRAEPAGFVHLLAPQVASGAKKMLVTEAWLDKQVSNQATEILARSLGVGSLEGSVKVGLVDIPDLTGPVDSAYVSYDTGSFDIYDPAQAPPIIPALANQIPSSVCDPHGVRFLIPDSIDQVTAFLQPGGQIENFCNGTCDAVDVSEQPDGGPPCDPLAP